MSAFLTFLAVIALAAVLLVLFLGLGNMMRGGPGNTSQKLMRARVMLQALALLLIVVVLLMAR
ncbi:twin transmembrane helix small protein [Consotaella salsifontis]|uniref:Hypoxia induced protein conserved region n=1 Tax=Consotaella salsifontis TaxID=1365950 RepID=A0A1T4RS50_9HYPH|nr:twin transmembrane helix small protein [Consotaella salsifontis]SKA18762.1 Hypoxia induced protein conserved region [Consotaella salsifontis]